MQIYSIFRPLLSFPLIIDSSIKKEEEERNGDDARHLVTLLRRLERHLLQHIPGNAKKEKNCRQFVAGSSLIGSFDMTMIDRFQSKTPSFNVNHVLLLSFSINKKKERDATLSM